MRRPKKRLIQSLLLLIILCLSLLYQSFTSPAFQFHHDGFFSTYSTELDGDLTELFVGAIGEAKECISCMNYAVKDKKIIQALNASSARGIPITLVYDSSASPGLEASLSPAIDKKRHEGNGLMHMKLLAIDHKIAYLGSANFTHSSLTKHANTVIRLDHPGIAALIDQKAKIYPETISRQSHAFELGRMQIDFSFLPDDPKASQRVKSLLRSAQSTIDVAMFTFTRMDFAEELLAAKNRGVAVTVTMDAGSMSGTSSKVAQYLQKNGVEVKAGVSDGLYHHKMALIDKKLWIVGSANWTKSAFGKNGEYLLILNKK